MFDTWQELLVGGAVALGVVAIIVFGLRSRWRGVIGPSSDCAYVEPHAQMLGRIDSNVTALRAEVAVQNKKAAISLATSEALVHVGEAAIKYMTKRQLNGEVESAVRALDRAKVLLEKAEEVEVTG